MALRHLVRRPVRRALHGLGYEIAPIRPPWPADFREADIALYREVAPYTMTTPEAIYALAEAVRYLAANEIPGAIVECGVWKGGSMMAVARTLLELGRTDVDLYLFDTFEGMTEPTGKDIHWTGESAKELLAREARQDSILWARAPLEQVLHAMSSVGYPAHKTHFVKGRVEVTIPDQAPDLIALLRLDTDWYESTKHELVHLYPRLAPGGVLILDDYTWWRGAGEATDEYLRDNRPAPLLVRIDDGGVRVAVKPDAGPTRK
jgi:O-methyltransferase